MTRGLALWLLLIPTALYACGDEVEDESATQSKSSGGSQGGAALEAACLAYCDATAAIDCGGQQLTEAQCKAGCPLAEEQLGSQCIAEYTAALQCAAQGGFECYEETPIPLATCGSEGIALAECMDGADCRAYCEAATEAGCGGESEAACVASCEQELESYEEPPYCDFEYEDVLRCYGREDLTCVDGRATSEACTRELLDMGDCLSRDDSCAGWCWVADELGCGDGCEAECRSRSDDSACGFEYEELLRCQLWAGGASCQDGALISDDACTYENERYDECLDGN